MEGVEEVIILMGKKQLPDRGVKMADATEHPVRGR
jgi:hypothetical protein